MPALVRTSKIGSGRLGLLVPNQVAAEIQKSGLDALTQRLETQGAAALDKMDKDDKK